MFFFFFCDMLFVDKLFMIEIVIIIGRKDGRCLCDTSPYWMFL